MSDPVVSRTGDDLVRQMRMRRRPVIYHAPIAPPHSTLSVSPRVIVAESERGDPAWSTLAVLFFVGLLAVGMSVGLVRFEPLLALLPR